MPSNRQVPLEVTQGVIQPEDRPVYANDDVPVQERGGVPYEVWDTNRQNGEAPRLTEKSAKQQRATADLTKSLNIPDDFTQREQARADAIGQQKLASEKELGNTPEQQRERESQLISAQPQEDSK